MNLTHASFLTLISSLGFLGLLALTLRRLGFAEPRSRWLEIYLSLSMLWLGLLIAIQFLPSQPLLNGISTYGWILSSLAFLFLYRLAMQDQSWGATWQAAGFLWLVALLAADLRGVTLPGTALSRSTVLLAGFGLLHAALAALAWHAQKLRLKRLIRNQANYYIAAWFFTLLADILYGFGPAWLQGLPAGSHLLRLAAALLATAAFGVDRLPNLRRTLGWLAGYLILALPVIALILAGLLLHPLVLRFVPTHGLAGLAVLLGLFLVWLQIVLWPHLPRPIGHLFLGSEYDAHRVLREYSLGISNINNLQALAATAVGLIGEAVGTKRGAMFNIEYEAAEKSFRLVCIGSMGVDHPEDGYWAETSPFVQAFKQFHQPLLIYDQEIPLHLLQAPAAEREWLVRQEMEIFAPIYTKDEWIGLLELGPKSSGVGYLESDLSLITTLSYQTSIALENARLMHSLIRLNNDFRRAYNALDQSNRQLQQAVNQLQKLDQAKSDFISISSHELRTPLTVMRGYNEMLLEDPSIQANVYQNKLVKGIHAGMMRMHEVVDSMIDMASIDAKSLQLHKEPVSLNALLFGVGDRLNEGFRERRIALKLENLLDLPTIQADDEALQKVFYQLVSNAIKFTPDGGTITITGSAIPAGQWDLPEGGIEVIIADTGIGIKPEFLETIFTKFYQTGELSLHSTGKVKFKGAGPGLGLAIAKGIVEAHGGKVWAESTGMDEDNCPGSQFHVILPKGA